MTTILRVVGSNFYFFSLHFLSTATRLTVLYQMGVNSTLTWVNLLTELLKHIIPSKRDYKDHTKEHQKRWWFIVIRTPTKFGNPASKQTYFK